MERYTSSAGNSAAAEAGFRFSLASVRLVLPAPANHAVTLVSTSAVRPTESDPATTGGVSVFSYDMNTSPPYGSASTAFESAAKFGVPRPVTGSQPATA